MVVKDLRKGFTHEQTFNIVANHMLTQGCKAVYPDGTHCMYRINCDDKLLMCAAGCLIPEDKYDPDFEGFMVEEKDSRVGKVIKELGHDISLVTELQRVHDLAEPEEWRERLLDVAKRYAIMDTSVLMSPPTNDKEPEHDEPNPFVGDYWDGYKSFGRT